MLGVEVLRQGKAKQISGLGRLRLRTHKNPCAIFRKQNLLSQDTADSVKPI
jgi:hypothetical protein